MKTIADKLLESINELSECKDYGKTVESKDGKTGKVVDYKDGKYTIECEDGKTCEVPEGEATFK